MIFKLIMKLLVRRCSVKSLGVVFPTACGELLKELASYPAPWAGLLIIQHEGFLMKHTEFLQLLESLTELSPDQLKAL